MVWASLFSFPTNSNYTCKQNGYPEATFSKIKLATDPGEYEDVALIDLKQWEKLEAQMAQDKKYVNIYIKQTFKVIPFEIVLLSNVFWNLA